MYLVSNCPLYFVVLRVVSLRLDCEKGAKELVNEPTPKKIAKERHSEPSPPSTVDAFEEDIDEEIHPFFFFRSVMV